MAAGMFGLLTSSSRTGLALSEQVGSVGFLKTDLRIV
jgi:hypothetical protein